ncbi:MAG: glycosyltransferase family 87 protein [Alphaproteobacteria bacterium]
MNGLEDIRPQLERCGSLMFTAAIIFLVLYSAGVILVLNAGVIEGDSRQDDFVAFWAAAKLAIAGDPVAAFDQDILRRAQSLPPGDPPSDYFWRYPPAFHILITPLGLLPYSAAWLLFNLISLAAFSVALWRRAAPVPMGHNLIFCAPIVLITYVLGQASLLWAAALVAAFSALERDRPVVAGLLIAMLSLKPQLGILIPFALAAGGHWRVILWSSIWVFIVHGAATLVVGMDYWAEFFGGISRAAEGLESGETPRGRMVSVYAFLRFLGLAHPLSLASQWLMTALLAAGVFLLWRRPTARFDLKAAALCIAIPLATPYSFTYELTLSVPAVIFMVRSGIGVTAFDRVMLGTLIFGPAVSWALGSTLSLTPLFAPLLLLVFGRCLAQAFWPVTPERAAAPGAN